MIDKIGNNFAFVNNRRRKYFNNRKWNNNNSNKRNKKNNSTTTDQKIKQINFQTEEIKQTTIDIIIIEDSTNPKEETTPTTKTITTKETDFTKRNFQITSKLKHQGL